MNQLVVFKKLAELFNFHGYRLFLVGGCVRDLLLNRPLSDIDITSDATPNQIKKFLPNEDYRFEQYGCVKINYLDVRFELTTLREESLYNDSRHPSDIRFVKDINIDYLRRDFTINAMYMDEQLHLIDPSNGKRDLANGVIKMIGNPNIRLVEDPLRILRAIRFSLDLGLTIDNDLLIAIDKYQDLLKELQPLKIKEEISKIKSINKDINYKDLIKLILKK